MASAPYIPAQSGRLRLKDAARPGPIGARVYGALAKMGAEFYCKVPHPLTVWFGLILCS